MTTKLNLASKRFRNRSLPWIVTALVIVVSLASLVYIVRATRRADAQARAVQNDINTLKEQERVLREQAAAVKASLTTEQLQTLEAAHALVDRKQFYWSRLFADLETALPGSVRVKRIAVRGVGRAGDQTLADLELTVIAKTSTAVTDMIAEMSRQGIFQAELRAQNLQRGRGEIGAEYELFVRYRPRAGMPTEASKPGSDSISLVSKGAAR